MLLTDGGNWRYWSRFFEGNAKWNTIESDWVDINRLASAVICHCWLVNAINNHHQNQLRVNLGRWVGWIEFSLSWSSMTSGSQWIWSASDWVLGLSISVRPLASQITHIQSNPDHLPSPGEKMTYFYVVTYFVSMIHDCCTHFFRIWSHILAEFFGSNNI